MARARVVEHREDGGGLPLLLAVRVDATKPDGW